MRDYAVLINALKAMSNTNSCFYCQGEHLVCEANGCILSNAADAIEELLRKMDAKDSAIEFGLKRIENLQDENEQLKDQVPTWISVEDELPESGERVLIMFEPFEDDENISIGWLTKSGFDCYDDSVYFFRSVTHWMPLPAPPKEVE